MADEVEQGAGASQDPTQQTAAPAASPEPVQSYQPSPGPWARDLQQTFTDPQQAAAVDAFLRSHVQPHVTKLEQQYAETEAARQMLDAFQTDADAANVAVNRQLYGNDYADQLAASLNRPDLLVGQQPGQQPVPQESQPAQLPPEFQEMYQDWSERRQQQQYDEAKSTFLSDPQYADINSDLFDPFVAGADTWEEAASAYRAYAAQFTQAAPEVETPPPTIGSQAGGAPGSTPSQPHETLDEAIDAIFNENAPIAPPVMGQ